VANYKDPENTLLMDTSKGMVVIECLADKAPGHVAHIKALAREGFYDGVVFHRVIDGFMAQGGDPTGTGTGGSTKPNLKAEFNDERHIKGICSMARSGHPDSANSQFFICFDDATFLDGQYTAWGRVIEGMDNVDNFIRGEPPQNPEKILSMKVAADVKTTKKPAAKKKTVAKKKPAAKKKTVAKKRPAVKKKTVAKKKVVAKKKSVAKKKPTTKKKS